MWLKLRVLSKGSVGLVGIGCGFGDLESVSVVFFGLIFYCVFNYIFLFCLMYFCFVFVSFVSFFL